MYMVHIIAVHETTILVGNIKKRRTHMYLYMKTGITTVHSGSADSPKMEVRKKREI